MSVKSEKSLLQEYFQIRHLALPKYTSSKCGGSDHNPVWKSKVTFWSVMDNEFKEATGDSCRNKVKAENSAAATVLDILRNPNVTTQLQDLNSCNQNITREFHRVSGKKRIVAERTALFVDVENLPKFVDEVVKEIEGINIYAFIGYHHCLSEKIFPDNVTKVLSPSTRSDGSDTCMQVYIGYMLAHETYDTYLIATRDHYGSALVEMITTDSLLWKKKDAKVVTQVSHINA